MIRHDIDDELPEGAWDTELFDCEIVVERTGVGEFDRDTFAAVLGIDPRSISKLMSRGIVPKPYRTEEHPRHGFPTNIWTPAQVAATMLLRQKRKAERAAPFVCGTAAGYNAHRRLKEPIDEACRKAGYKRRNELNALMRERRKAEARPGIAA